MQELKCPNCGEVFQVDESGYAQIVSQIRDKEFEAELRRRETQLNEKKNSDLEIIRLNQEKKQEEALAKNAAEMFKKEQEIAQLKAKLDSVNSEKKIAVMEAVGEKEKQLQEKTAEITMLKSKLDVKDTESELSIKSLRERYEAKLRDKEEQIEYYKDFKARQSTKMVGESLEQHCLNEFNNLRMTAFPNAYFEKDNDATSGSKGDFIFRDYVDGIEYISIMFEMKNEADETKTKHKNEDFFKELDKDRKEKKCEYAVLVSLLEGDSDYYNNGIVDVSYRYEKMYVIRPQFFVPLISLLKNAALNSLEYRKQLEIVRNQQLDLVNFEDNMETFKTGFARNFELASRKFKDAINEIDKSISQLQKVKDALTSSERNLRLANDKAQELSIKKLTKNAPSVKEMFDEMKK
ncbi:MAG: DUF2130 domain-containing protein [bacterium]|nr:DUF2130 domain-containing protein [bacterium]